MSLSRFLGRKTLMLIMNHESFNKYDKEIVEYGLIMLYSTIVKLVIVVLLALSFGVLKEIALCAFVFGLLRSFAGGFHAKTSLGCLISMNIVYFSVYLLSSILPYSIYLYWISLIFCLVTIIAYAPADTAEKPITNLRQIRIMKLSSILVLLSMFYLAYFYFTEITKNIIILSCIFECATILPFMYIITKSKRGDQYYEILE